MVNTNDDGVRAELKDNTLESEKILFEGDVTFTGIDGGVEYGFSTITVDFVTDDQERYMFIGDLRNFEWTFIKMRE